KYEGSDTLASRTLQKFNEQEVYVDPNFKGTDGKLNVNPFSINNGVLTIHAAPASAATQNSIWGYDYTSGVITTKQSFAQENGYFEMRAQVPNAVQGMAPAFWLMPTDGSWPPEIDIMETIGGWTENTGVNVHTNQTGTPTENGAHAYLPVSADGFHTY